MSKVSLYSAIATKSRIDADKGIIYGVSAITKGPAEGHGFDIDDTTLTQVLDAGSKFSDGLKVRFNHPARGTDALVQSNAGTLRNFQRDGDKAIADLHLLKTDPFYPKLIEMAEKMPDHFGLSIVTDFTTQETDGKKFLRITGLEAADLVDSPAANKGLFSKLTVPEKQSTQLTVFMTIDPKKLALALKLPETANEAEIETAMLAKLSAPAPAATDLTELTKKITEATTELGALKAAGANAVALAQKAEIDNLMAEASRNGQVVPLDNDDLYTVKDGICSIKTAPAQLSKMIQKLPKGTVQLAGKRVEFKADKDGKVPAKGSPEFREQLSAIREQGKAALSAKFAAMTFN